MQALTLRLACMEERETLLQIHQASVQGLCTGQYTAEQIAHWLDGRDATMYTQGIAQQRLWVACAPEPLGFVEISADSIDKLFILPQAAGLGVGKVLLTHALNTLHAQGLRHVVIEATLTAAPFYQKHGFRQLNAAISAHGGVEAPLPVVNMQWDAPPDATDPLSALITTAAKSKD